MQPLHKIAIMREIQSGGVGMENGHFIFCDSDGRLNCIRLCDLTKEQFCNLAFKFAEYADKCISEIGRGKRYGK